ncbi:hypothetical protein [Methyloceanibacter sp.]|uniref:hypothetical protein n=1 Tax=Methyloceanibacter sp. TaxID=1965321 RepID=UPI003C73C79C
MRALPEGGARSYLASIDAMQETAETSPLQLLFIELRVGLARSAIQAALLLNGGASVALLLLLASLLPPAPGGLPVNLVLLKWAFAIFGLGLFLAGMNFVNAYVAQGAIATGRSSAFGNTMRRLGLNLIVASLLLDCPCGSRDLT